MITVERSHTSRESQWGKGKWSFRYTEFIRRTVETFDGKNGILKVAEIPFTRIGTGRVLVRNFLY